MSRYNPYGDITPILRAAENWKKKCLLKDGSVFSKEELWTKANFELLQKYFVERLDGSKKSFLEKLRGQLGDAPSQTNRLIAELLWIMCLPDTDLNLSTKIDEVCEVWGLSGEKLDEGRPEFTQINGIAGIGSMGMTIKAKNKPLALIYFIRFMLHWKKRLTTEEREGLIEDPQSFAQALEKWEQSEPTTVGKEEGGFVEEKMEFKDKYLHSSLLYLLFPDYFERIFNQEHKRKIAERLIGIANVNNKSLFKIDKHLYEYRKKKEKEWHTEKGRLPAYSRCGLLRIKEKEDIKDGVHRMMGILLNESLLPKEEIENLQDKKYTTKWFALKKLSYSFLQDVDKTDKPHMYLPQAYPYWYENGKANRYRIHRQWTCEWDRFNRECLFIYLAHLLSINENIKNKIKGLDYYHAPLALKNM